MRAIAIAAPGLEPVAAEEVKSIVGKAASVLPCAVSFECSPEELCIFAYMARSVRRVLCHMGSFTFGSLEEAHAELSSIVRAANLSGWPLEPFAVSCDRWGSHFFSGQDVAEGIARAVSEVTGAKMTYRSPAITIVAAIAGSAGHLGIDVCGFELDKRDYLVFPHPAQIRGTVAFAALWKSGFRSAGLLDAFCRSGAIAIEAALLAQNRSAHFYRKDSFAFHSLPLFAGTRQLLEKQDAQVRKTGVVAVAMDSLMRNVRAAQKNAKIAGVNKAIDFARFDVEWLDTKFGKGELSFAVSQFPMASKRVPRKLVGRLAREYFRQLSFVLDEKGAVVLLVREIELVQEAALQFKFALQETTELHGELKLAVFRRGS